MAANIQFLRTNLGTTVPTGLAAGQIAFNLANDWIFVGNGSADIYVNGVALTTYNSAQTILGVANVNVPPKPIAGQGYNISSFDNTVAAAGESVYTITDDLVDAAAGASTSAKIVAALITAGSITAAGDLNEGDIAIVLAGTGSPFAGIELGGYAWDSTAFLYLAGMGLPDATVRSGTADIGTGGTKGVVYLARDSDVKETGAAGSTVPDPLAVATAQQLKDLAIRLAGLTNGQNILGTYDASTSLVASVTAEASAGGRAGFAPAANISAGSGMLPGDYFIVETAGTITGETDPINVAVNAGDKIFYDGGRWRVIPLGNAGGGLLTGLSDVDDKTVQVVSSVNTKGFLLRDDTVADGLPGAYRLAAVLDLGTF